MTAALLAVAAAKCKARARRLLGSFGAGVRQLTIDGDSMPMGLNTAIMNGANHQSAASSLSASAASSSASASASASVSAIAAAAATQSALSASIAMMGANVAVVAQMANEEDAIQVRVCVRGRTEQARIDEQTVSVRGNHFAIRNTDFKHNV